MIKIGITGQPGFIGNHIFNHLGLRENVSRIPFKDEYFESNINHVCSFYPPYDPVIGINCIQGVMCEVRKKQ